VIDLLSVGGVFVLLLAGGLSIPHWVKRWRMGQAFSKLQRMVGSGEVATSWLGWPRFAGRFEGRPCQINFETTLVSSSYGALGDLAARYRLGLALRHGQAISFERPSVFAKWFRASPRARNGKGLVIAGEFWNVRSADVSAAKRLADHPEFSRTLQALRFCKLVTLDHRCVEALEVEVSRQELRAERLVSMLTLLNVMAKAAETLSES